MIIPGGNFAGGNLGAGGGFLFFNFSACWVHASKVLLMGHRTDIEILYFFPHICNHICATTHSCILHKNAICHEFLFKVNCL
jgi:hypothetical protein